MINIHTNDLEIEMVVYNEWTGKNTLTAWEWGLHNGKMFKRWFARYEGENWAHMLFNQPQIVKLASG